MSTIEKTASVSALPTGVWRVDPAHSSIGFAVKHMMIATVRGRFREFEGTLEVGGSGVARAHGKIKAASIDTGEASRDEHLRSADFLDVESHPEIRFEAKSIQPVGDAQLRVTGWLNLRGVTGVIALDASMPGVGRDPWGKERLALELRGEIDREQFGLRWNKALETGGVLVGEHIELELDISTVREAERAAA